MPIKKYEVIVHCQFKASSQEDFNKLFRNILVIMELKGIVKPKSSWGL